MRNIKFLQFFSPTPSLWKQQQSNSNCRQGTKTKKQAEVPNSLFRVRRLQCRPFHATRHQNLDATSTMKPSLKPPSVPLECPLRGNFFMYSSCPLITLYSHYLSNTSFSSQTMDSFRVWSVVLLFSLFHRAPGSNVSLQMRE